MPVETELYELLKVNPDASSEDIKKAFRKQALVHHPDRGGDEEMFKKIQNAYEILSEPQKREIYDKQGKNGLKNSGVSEDILSRMFNMGNIFSMFTNFNNKTKSSSTIHTLNVSLEKLCTREIIKLKVTRDRICSCTKVSKDCIECKGQGMKTVMRQFGPFIQQNIQPCDSCTGGKIYTFCGNCRRGIIDEPKIFQIHLSPEVNNGFQFQFKEEGNQTINSIPGDFIVIINYEKHPVFEVRGKDLILTKTITLKEALCGHEISLIHPCGELVKINIDEVTTPYTIRYTKKGLSEDGKLEINYKIAFPDKLEKHQLEILADVL
jgi:DnaJ family protein A protein 2